MAWRGYATDRAWRHGILSQFQDQKWRKLQVTWSILLPFRSGRDNVGHSHGASLRGSSTQQQNRVGAKRITRKRLNFSFTFGDLISDFGGPEPNKGQPNERFNGPMTR